MNETYHNLTQLYTAILPYNHSIYLYVKVVGFGRVADKASFLGGPDADFVVQVAQVLQTLKVERLDGAHGSKVVLGAPSGGLDLGRFAAIDLGYPDA